MQIKTVPSVILLTLASTSALAHGPHAEVVGNGIGEFLLHLFSHAWPVLPLALALPLVLRYLRSR